MVEKIIRDGTVNALMFAYPKERQWLYTDGDIVPSPAMLDHVVNLSECPCDPRRRHERLWQKVAVV